MDFFSSAFLIVSDPVSIDLPELFIMDPNANRIDKKSHFYFYANPDLKYLLQHYYLVKVFILISQNSLKFKLKNAEM
jgi:hypothetical protein